MPVLHLLYCSYIKFMYRINSIWLAGLFITLSIAYTGLYTKELVDIATEAFHPYTIIAEYFVSCTNWQKIIYSSRMNI